MPAGGQIIIETRNVDVAPDEIPAGSSGVAGPNVRLTVRDSGIGMDEKTTYRVFEPFFTTRSKGSGTGLGLSVVYGIVAQWRGFLKVRSEAGKGSDFSVYLPLTASASLVSDSVIAAGNELALAPVATVLVVDDQDIVRGFVAESLRICGYSVLQAGCGAEALRTIRRNTRIDLLLTDLLMPGMRGEELARRARALRPSLKVLFMTGYAHDFTGNSDLRETDSQKNDTLDNVGEVIMKPRSAAALEARVQELLCPR